MTGALTRRILMVAGMAVLVVAARANAQALTNIGQTSAGTPVMLETRSVSKVGGITTATVRSVLQPAIKAPGGDYKSTRSTAMFDCAKQTVATKERWFFTDEKGTKVARHDTPGKPGFGPASKGSLAGVAMIYLCATGAK